MGRWGGGVDEVYRCICLDFLRYEGGEKIRGEFPPILYEYYASFEKDR